MQATTRHVNPGVSRITNLVIRRGRGAWVEADDGQRYLDFTCGIAVTNTGHCHPAVTQAIHQQVDEMLHCQTTVGYHAPMLRLIERLRGYLPGSLDSFFFWNSGAEAIEAALKIARQHTNKQNVVVFQGSYHGRTMGTMGLTTSKTVYSERFGPFMPGIFVAPFPYATQLPPVLAQSTPAAVEHCLRQVELLLKQQTAPSDTAAMLIEPVLGEGGYVPAPPEFLRGLRDICDKNGIVLIFDEVQTGYGRTGKMFALEHSGVVPDVLVLSKGIASGLPLSCVIAKSNLTAKQPPGSMGGTFAGNVVSCAAALGTLDALEKDNLLANTVARGHQLRGALEALKAKGYPISDVRGLGLMIGVEFDDSCPKGSTTAIVKSLIEHEQVLLLTCSAFEVLRFIPPLTVTEDEVNKAVTAFQRTLDRLGLIPKARP